RRSGLVRFAGQHNACAVLRGRRHDGCQPLRVAVRNGPEPADGLGAHTSGCHDAVRLPVLCFPPDVLAVCPSLGLLEWALPWQQGRALILLRGDRAMHPTHAHLLAVLAAVLSMAVVSTGAANPQTASPSVEAALVVKGVVKQEVRVSPADLKSMP